MNFNNIGAYDSDSLYLPGILAFSLLTNPTISDETQDNEIDRKDDYLLFNPEDPSVGIIRYQPGKMYIRASGFPTVEIMITNSDIVHATEEFYDESELIKQSLSTEFSIDCFKSFSPAGVFAWRRYRLNDDIDIVSQQVRMRNDCLMGLISANAPLQVIENQLNLLNRTLEHLPGEELKVFGISLPVTKPIGDEILEELSSNGPVNPLILIDYLELHYYGEDFFRVKWCLSKDLSELSEDAVTHFTDFLLEEGSEVFLNTKGQEKEIEIPIQDEGYPLEGFIDQSWSMLRHYQKLALASFKPLNELYERTNPGDEVYLSNPFLA